MPYISPGPPAVSAAEDPTERAQDNLIQQALFNLIPYFLDGAGGDRTRARNAAYEMLRAYPIRSMLELQLATKIIAFSQSAMDDLRRAKADPEMPEEQHGTLRTRAVKLGAAEHRTVRRLHAVYKTRTLNPAEARPTPGPKPPPEATLGPDAAAMLRAMQDKVAQHRAQTAAAAAAPGVPGNHDPRRAAKPDARREARHAAG